MKIVITFISLLMFGTVKVKCQDVIFPRQLTNEGSVLTIYQPQVDGWEQYKKIHFRMAFSLKPVQNKDVVGVLHMEAATEVNMDNHRVLIADMSVVKTNFPSLDDASAEKMGKIVRSFITPDRTQLMSLEQIVACTPKKDSVPTVAVNNDPPVIFMSKKPTILIQIDGPPVKAAASKENIEFVINANYPLFYDLAGKNYYLYDGLEWQKAPEGTGPWAFTNTLPTALINLAKDSNWSMLKETFPAPAKPDKKFPAVYYSESLAELILFEGEPVYKTIRGTALKFATNTNSDIFFCSADKRYYYITSGRWFSATNLNGPWTYATSNLPNDFSKIPHNSPAAAILPFVPGTEQAKDAVMIAQIPTTIKVDAVEAAKSVNIVYSGEPEFKPVEKTTLYYAVNTTEKVIKVSSNQYFACVQGIWFVSAVPTGPWQTATVVPQIIYDMPPSSPVYNVTYVTQTVTTTNVVHATYTSGYMGVYIVPAPAGVIIISGTGFYHPPYYYYPPYGYPIYYPYPVTYGMYAYHPYHYGGVAYHASYNSATGMYSRSATVYNPYGKATVAQGYNPSTGTYARGASVSTPYGSRSAAQAYNPYTGGAASTRQGSSPTAHWGTTSVSKNGQTARAAHVSTAGGSAAAIKTGSGDMYAAANGKVYKNTGNGWQDASGPQPKTTSTTGAAPKTQPAARTTPQAQLPNANRPTAGTAPVNNAASMHTQDLNKDYQNRQRGNAQTQQYNSKANTAQPTQSRGSRSGGGRRG